MSPTLGWRHFQVVRQKKHDKMVFLLVQASCDAAAQLWVNADNLKDRSLWAAGWLQMSEVRDPELAVGVPCRSCAGSGLRKCVACEGRGYARLITL